MLNTQLMQSESWVFMGGTFDPIHKGHLNIALCAAAKLEVSGLGFVPCHITPHKDQPSTPSASRVEMIRQCIDSQEFAEELKQTNVRSLTLEEYELSFARPSYTLHTLQYLRKQLGANTPIYWLLGMDSINTIDSWYQWHRLLDYAHIVVVNRPGHPLKLSAQLKRWWLEHFTEFKSLGNSVSGRCLSLTCKELDISSTKIRDHIANKCSVTSLVPNSVEQYITDNKLYLIEE